MTEQEELKCPNCKAPRSLISTAKTKGIRTCRRCGHSWPVVLPEQAARKNMEEEGKEEES